MRLFFLRWWKIRRSFTPLTSLSYPRNHIERESLQSPRNVNQLFTRRVEWTRLQFYKWLVHTTPWLRKMGETGRQQKETSIVPHWISVRNVDMAPTRNPDSQTYLGPIQSINPSKNLQMGKSRWKMSDNKYLFKLNIEFQLSNCLSGTRVSAKVLKEKDKKRPLKRCENKNSEIIF